MRLRSLRIVGFAGATEASTVEFPDRGVVYPGASPAGAVAADALRFAFAGGPQDLARAVPGERGFAHVEVSLALPGGDEISIFRGMDRRGSVQVSLRMSGAPRVLGGEEAVRRRLEEAGGVPFERWARATWLDHADPDEDLFAPPVRVDRLEALPAPPPVAPVAEEGAKRDVDGTAARLVAAREAAERDVETLRRALRAEALKRRAEADYAALCAFGARLRRERTLASVESDRLDAERERLRVRIRQLGEYRRLLASQFQAEAERGSAVEEPHAALPGRARLFGVSGAACAFALAVLRSTPGLAGERTVSILLGAAALVLFAAYVRTAIGDARRPAAARRGAAQGTEWRDALRRRFADLGDPDAPGLLEGLREKLAAVESGLAPARRRLERLDDAVAALDVEAGRASKASHGSLPPRAEAEEGLADGEDAEGAAARVARLGDAVYHAAVERDALVAAGAAHVETAAAAARDAVRALGDAAGSRAAAESALRRAGLGDSIDAEGLRRDEENCVRLLDLVDSIARPRSPDPPPDPASSGAAGDESVLPDAGGDAVRLLGDVVGALTGRSFVLVQAGAAIELRLQGPSDPRPLGWLALPLDAREKLALALRLRRGEEELGRGEAARFVVLASVPASLGRESALAEFVAMVAPSVAQVVVADAAPAPASAPARAARRTRLEGAAGSAG